MLVIVIVVLGLSIVVFDGFIVNLVLLVMVIDLKVSDVDVIWVINSY